MELQRSDNAVNNASKRINSLLGDNQNMAEQIQTLSGEKALKAEADDAAVEI